LSEPASKIELQLQSEPSSLTVLRGMLAGLGEWLRFDRELLDDIKTAISEAANNVVLHAYPDGTGPLTVTLAIHPDQVETAVIDRGQGFQRLAAGEDHMGLGLAVMSALADRAEFESEPGVGTVVRMAFGSRGESFRVPAAAGRSSAEAALSRGADVGAQAAGVGGVPGDVRLRVCPPTLLGGVLGRLTRALAATAHFTLDRFSDLYLITDELSAHGVAAAVGSQLAFGIGVRPGRLELALGPLRRGSVERLARDGKDGQRAFPLVRLLDELSSEPAGEGELLRAVVADRRRPER